MRLLDHGIDKLLASLEKTSKNYDIEKIKKAYKYAKELHEGQFRKSGEEYISHPIAVAEIVAELELDTDSICAALLHDTVEDCSTKINIEKIKKEFGLPVAELVDGLTKLVQIPFEDKEEEHIENLRKMFLAMSKDIRVIFIKLCDRLHNMRTLDACPEDKRRLTALETMHVYAPLAHRLGMQCMKQELENLAISYLDPIGYNEVKADIERRYGMNIDFIERAKMQIAEQITEHNIKFTLEGRVKSVYSIYKKMYDQKKSFDKIYDFYALRVIVDTEHDCYAVLGVIHDTFKSIPGRFKDYISTPKPNMYRSLHTTVIGRDGIPFEVQIRTWEMHQIAEYGIAAHWKYKANADSEGEIEEKLGWIAKLVEMDDDTRDQDEFLQALKIDIFHDEVFVFTPKGDVITMPQGATVIDFAYAIHSGVGNKMIAAKINGMIVPIDRILQNGEIIEIITSASSKGPSRNWLKIVKTSEARNKIRQWFKKEKRAENIVVGQTEIDREFRRFSVPCTEQQKNDILTNIIVRLGINSIDDLYNTVGYGGLSVSKILPKLKDEFERIVKHEEDESEIITDTNQIPTVTLPKNKKSSSSIIVDDIEGCHVKFAKCCNPLPGDDIIGFITKGYGISIHSVKCPNVLLYQENPAYASRWKSVRWENSVVSNNNNDKAFETMLQIFAVNTITLLAHITTALAEMNVSLLQINTQKKTSTLIIINIVISCKNTEHVKAIISRLKTIAGIENIVRGFS